MALFPARARGGVLAVTGILAWRLIVSGPVELASLFALGVLGLFGVFLLYGGMSWLVVMRKDKPGGQRPRQRRRARRVR